MTFFGILILIFAILILCIGVIHGPDHVSFDGDTVLCNPEMGNLVRQAVFRGQVVHITSRRPANFNNADLYKVAKNYSIPKDQVKFYPAEKSTEFLLEYDAHFDDNLEVLSRLQDETKHMRLMHCAPSGRINAYKN